MKEIIIIDFDGTLVNSEKYYLLSFYQILKIIFPNITKEDIKEIFGIPTFYLFFRFVRNKLFSKKLCEFQRFLFFNFFSNKIKRKGNVNKCLKKLKKKFYLVLWTNNYKKDLDLLFKICKIDPKNFHNIICGEKIIKPDLKTFKKMVIKKREVFAVIGDGIIDYNIAKKLNAKFFCIKSEVSSFYKGKKYKNICEVVKKILR